MKTTSSIRMDPSAASPMAPVVQLDGVFERENPSFRFFLAADRGDLAAGIIDGAPLNLCAENEKGLNSKPSPGQIPATCVVVGQCD